MPSLPATVSSPNELTALILEVRAYATWFNQYVVIKKTGVTREDAQPEISAAASELIRDWSHASPLSGASLDQLVRELEHLKTTASVITITLAAPAPHDVRQQLVTWCREQLSPDILVSFRFNSTILGGMVVRVGSHIYDWSFRRQLMDGRSKFAEVASRV